MTTDLVPAAQYLRKSTEHQQYSLENQADTIQQYATQNGMNIVETYSDKTSGMQLNRRTGLRRLLHDVTKGTPTFKIILVYDVSRWGRFLDADESAYYEFLCKVAGIRVHYCAEQFTNDGTLISSLVKSIKRMMAAEYSRELSAKVLAGQRRICQLGFKAGGCAGFGLRRMLISKDGQAKKQLEFGERKSIQDDHVVLIAGPDHEVQCVREIYRMFLEEDKYPTAISNELNRRGIKFPGVKRTQWCTQIVNRILRSPKYRGSVVYGRTSQALNTPRTNLSPDAWVTVLGAWKGIVDVETFNRVQERFHTRPKFKSDERLLEELRELWKRKGSLKASSVTFGEGLSSIHIYRRRFGSFSNALVRLGFEAPRMPRIVTRRANKRLRTELLDGIVKESNGKVTLVQRGSFRPKLRLHNGVLVSVYVCSHRTLHGNPRWLLSRSLKEPNRVMLIARLDSTNNAIQDMYVIDKIPQRCSWTIKPDDPVLKRGLLLKSLAEFPNVVLEMKSRG